MVFSIIMVFAIGHYLNLFESKIELGFKHLLFFGNIGFGFFGLGYAFTGSGRVGLKSAIFVLSVFAFAFGAGWLAGNYS